MGICIASKTAPIMQRGTNRHHHKPPPIKNSPTIAPTKRRKRQPVNIAKANPKIERMGITELLWLVNKERCFY
jgi:hypothetical protein